MPEANLAEAYKWLSDERARVRAGRITAELPKTRFADFAVSVLEHKVQQEQWRGGLVELIAAGEYSPNTTNGWLAVLRVIAREAKRRFQLPELFTDGVPDFDTSQHVSYPEEAPNSLTREQVPLFLAALREMHPQHYAMAYLGFATGLRPSTLRPVRRSGSTPDVLWERGRILIRRSQTLGTQPLETTKQQTRYAIDLPEEALEVGAMRPFSAWAFSADMP